MSRWLFAAVLMSAWFSACSGEGVNLGPTDVSGNETMADSLGPYDGQEEWPDWTADQAPMSDAVDSATETDFLSDAGDTTDMEAPDSTLDIPEDQQQPGQWMDSCSAKAPCGADLVCLLLSEGGEGICLVDCGGEKTCPPQQDCVAPDPGEPTLKICVNRPALLEPCQVGAADLCQEGLYCVAPQGISTGICTSFCAMNQTLCGQGTVCQGVDPEDPTPDWGACLPIPVLSPCTQNDQCEWGQRCVLLGPENGRCVEICTGDAGCGNRQRCVGLVSAGGETVNGCVQEATQGSRCDEDRGIVCINGLDCAEAPLDEIFGRCAADCPEGGCPGGTTCVGATSETPGACLPLEDSVEPVAQCDEFYPCEDNLTCVSMGADGPQVCLETCPDSCPDGQTCLQGGCARLGGQGEGCHPLAGWGCEEGLSCLSDGGDGEAGVCASTCEGALDLSCPGETSCVETPQGFFCLRAAGFGDLCSLDDGWGCVTGLQCLHVGGGSDWGFCSASCQMGGSCPDADGQCVLKNADNWYCAWLCNDSPASCPEHLFCSGGTLCVP